MDKRELKKSFTFEDALFMVVGNMVGTGIFATAPLLLQYAPSTGDALLLWAFAGFICFSGAMCYTELALIIPNSGSEGIYIRHGFGFLNIRFGKTLGYLFSWTAIVLMKPASLAVMCDIFSIYFISVFTSDSTVFKIKFLSLSLISLLSLIANYSTFLSKNVSNTMFHIKCCLVSWIVLAGLFANVFNRELCQGNINFERSTSSTASYAQMLTIGLFDAGFAFDGWNHLNYMASEMKDINSLVKALKVGVPGVAVAYFLLNMSYFIVLDRDQILKTETVADVFGMELLGYLGILVPCFISLSALGAINGCLLSNSRVIYTAALEGDIPAVLATLSVHNTPSFGILLNWILTCIYIVMGDISSLLALFSPFYYGFLFLAAVSLIILRFKKARAVYRVPWFLLTSFLCTSCFLWLVPLILYPLKWIIGLGIILTGVLVKYWIPDQFYDDTGEDD